MRSSKIYGCEELRLPIHAGSFASCCQPWSNDRVHNEVTADKIDELKEIVGNQYIVL